MNKKAPHVKKMVDQGPLRLKSSRWDCKDLQIKRSSKATYYRSVKKGVDRVFQEIEQYEGYDGGSSSSEDVDSVSNTERICSRKVPLQQLDTASAALPLESQVESVELGSHGIGVDPHIGESSPVSKFSGDDTGTSHTSIENCFRTVNCMSDCSSCFEQDETTSAVNKGDLISELRRWAVNFNVPNTTTGALLRLLQPHLPILPKDPRTLMASKPITGISIMGEGEYFNFGLGEKLEKIIDCYPGVSALKLIVNVDGLPLFKSTNMECWPILVLVKGIKLPPFVCSVWCGPGKPPLVEYLTDFVEELKVLLAHGIVREGRHYGILLECFVCDAPARAFVKGIVGHTSYFGCEKCDQKGRYSGRMTFPSFNSPLRTDNSFVARHQPTHHTQLSPLEELGIGMVSAFPLDYMHLVCLGVGRRLLMWLLKGKKKVKRKVIKNEGLKTVIAKLALAKTFWPRDFSRKPRSVVDLKRWKATEFRQFILYLTPVVLSGSVLPDDYYNLVLLFHVAITILCREDLQRTLIDVAVKALKLFVKEARRLMGLEFLSYNVHNLIHLGADSKRYGPLPDFSSFPFENELNVLKRTVRGKTKPLQQLAGRILEREREVLLEPRVSSHPNGVLKKSLYKGGPRLHFSGSCYQKVFWNGRQISLLDGDNVIILTDGTIVFAHNFILTASGTFVIGKQFLVCSDLYVKPVASSDLGIYLVSKLGLHFKSWPLDKISSKGVAVPIRGSQAYAIYPLIN